MEAVYKWVRQIALVLILVGFVEILVPAGAMRRYVKLATGLLILFAILAPFVGVMEGLHVRTQETAVSLGDLFQERLQPPDATSQRLEAALQEQAIQTWRRAVEREVSELIRMAGYSPLAVQAQYEQQGGEPVLTGISAVVADWGVKPGGINPVRVEVTRVEDESQPLATLSLAGLQNEIAHHLEVAPACIHLQWEQRE